MFVMDINLARRKRERKIAEDVAKEFMRAVTSPVESMSSRAKDSGLT
jgi:hypothetical protein